jgi:hypothetical protein
VHLALMQQLSFEELTWAVAHLVQNIMENCELWCHAKLIPRSALTR